MRVGLLACIGHKPGKWPNTCFSFLKSNFPPEPLPERLYSAKISRAVWLVRFLGLGRISEAAVKTPEQILTGFLAQSRIDLVVSETTKSNIQKYNKVNPRTLPMLALFLVLGAAGVSQAGPQTTPPVPARQPLPSTVAGNPPKQAASEPAPTKIIHIYRGDGYFDNALAEKLRSVLNGKSQPAPSHGSPAPTDSSRASLGGGDGSKRGNLQ